jgi:HSP20 family protein
MTMVKLNPMPFEKTFNSLFEDLFQNLPNNLSGTEWNRAGGVVPVNIAEGPEGYRLEIVAPGMEKSDFKVNLEKNILTVSAEKKAEVKTENEKQLRREFSFRSFSRSFRVDDSIDTAKIEAKYENGILHLNLPKREEVKLLPKEICVN